MQFNQEIVDKLLRPILIPSGIWADYNWVVDQYYRVKEYQEIGLISGDLSIPFPDPDDYTNLDSPRSKLWNTI